MQVLVLVLEFPFPTAHPGVFPLAIYQAVWKPNCETLASQYISIWLGAEQGLRQYTSVLPPHFFWTPTTGPHYPCSSLVRINNFHYSQNEKIYVVPLDLYSFCSVVSSAFTQFNQTLQNEVTLLKFGGVSVRLQACIKYATPSHSQIVSSFSFYSFSLLCTCNGMNKYLSVKLPFLCAKHCYPYQQHQYSPRDVLWMAESPVVLTQTRQAARHSH